MKTDTNQPGETAQPPTEQYVAAQSNRYMYISLLVCSFLLGMLITKVQYIENSKKEVLAARPPAQQPQQPQQPTVTLDAIKALFTNGNITFGDKNSKTLLVEVADPSCPYCHIAAGKNPELNKQVGPQFLLESDGGTYIAPVPKMKELVDAGKAAFVWIYSPGHGNGEMGTKALYCAFENGKFWQVHDKLMNNEGYTVLNDNVKNDKTKSKDLANFLADAMDPTTLSSCLESGKYDTKINQDVAVTNSLGVRGTPGFFINTTNFAGAYSWKDMEYAVQ